VHPDGTVSGKVGDAILKNGKIIRGRGRILRMLNWGNEYIVKAELQGPIVAAESISRKSISMPLNFRGDSFVGGIHTSGSKSGGKAKMMLSASSLKLHKEQNPTE
jgi:hypothetical protein